MTEVTPEDIITEIDSARLTWEAWKPEAARLILALFARRGAEVNRLEGENAGLTARLEEVSAEQYSERIKDGLVAGLRAQLAEAERVIAAKDRTLERLRILILEGVKPGSTTEQAAVGAIKAALALTHTLKRGTGTSMPQITLCRHHGLIDCSECSDVR